MIKTKQVFNNASGQYAITEQQLIADTGLQLNDKSQYYIDPTGTKTVQLNLDNQGRLQYSTFNKTTRQWSEPGLLTPSTPYQLQSEKGQINGFANLDGEQKVPVNQIPLSKFYNVYQGTLANMTNQSYYSTAPVIGNIYIPTDSWQSFALANYNYTQASSWVSINKPQPPVGNQFFTAEASVDKPMVSSAQPVLYDNFQQSATSGITYSQGYFNIQPGTYKIDIQIIVQYQNTTNYPISYRAELQSTGIITKSVHLCDTVSNFNQRKSQNSFFVITFTQEQVLNITVLSNNYNSVRCICSGSSIHIAKIT